MRRPAASSYAKTLVALAILLGGLASAPRARADDAPDPAPALITAASVDVVSLIVGSAILAKANGDSVTDNAGWLTIQGGLVAAPLAAHAVAGQWGRGVLASLVPACALAGTAVLFAVEPGTIDAGTLPQQRWMWSFFTAGLVASTVGTLDVLWSPARTVSIAPVVGMGEVGIRVGGEL